MSRKVRALAITILVSFATTGVCQDNRELIDGANRQYDRDDNRASFTAYLSAIKVGSVDGKSWYRMAYSYEQLNGQREVLLKIYTVAKYILERDNTSSLYLQYASNKLDKLGAISLPGNQGQVNALIEQIKKTEIPKEMPNSAPIVAYVVLIILAFIVAVLVGKYLRWPALGIVIFPTFNLLCSLIATGQIFVLGLSIATGAVLFIVITIGGYRHPRKDGRADRRFKENPYVYVFPPGARALSRWGILGTILAAVILGIVQS